MSTYVCPMHAKVRAAGPVGCPMCGMRLVPEGTRFALLKHATGRQLHIAALIAAMAAVMAVALMLMQ